MNAELAEHASFDRLWMSAHGELVEPRGLCVERFIVHTLPTQRTRKRRSQLSRLKRPRPEQELDKVAFVRLQPVQLRRRHGPQVEPIDVHRIDQASARSEEHTSELQSQR